MNWFINKVYAETAGTAPAMEDVGMGSLLLSSILPFALIILVMYFMLIRPQRKKEKTLRDQINNMKIAHPNMEYLFGKEINIAFRRLY